MGKYPSPASLEGARGAAMVNNRFILSRSCQVFAMLLKLLGFPCVCLHSLMTQSERLTALRLFKSYRVKILVATDVASR